MRGSTVTRIGRRKPIRLYINEWMVAKALNQVEIASRIENQLGESMSSGTISKKLAKPLKMSTEWLWKFATALDVDVQDLYRHPDQPRPEDLLRDVEEPRKTMLIEMIKAAKRA